MVADGRLVGATAAPLGRSTADGRPVGATAAPLGPPWLALASPGASLLRSSCWFESLSWT